MFARTIGLPNDPIEATGDLLDALAHDSIQRVGLGAVNGRYFLFHVGMGFDAAVVAQVERRAGLKRYAGHPLFVYAGFDTWIRHYDRSRPRFSVRFADGTVVDDGYLSICLNTNPYTYLGNRPLNLAPEATLERGLAMVTLRTLAFARTMRIIGSALGNGKHLRTLALDRPPHRPQPAPRSPATARSRTRSTATTSATPSTSRSATNPTSSTSSCRSRQRDVGHVGRAAARASRATSGTLVTTASTPRSASQRMRSGSSQVQVLTARPASWAMRDEVLVDEHVVGVHGDVAALGGARRPGRGGPRPGRAASRWRARAPARGRGRWWAGGSTRRGSGRRRARPGPRAGRPRRRPAARWGRSPGRRASS